MTGTRTGERRRATGRTKRTGTVMTTGTSGTSTDADCTVACRNIWKFNNLQICKKQSELLSSHNLPQNWMPCAPINNGAIRPLSNVKSTIAACLEAASIAASCHVQALPDAPVEAVHVISGGLHPALDLARRRLVAIQRRVHCIVKKVERSARAET